MEIVLTHDVPALGRKGDIKNVKNGYYTNFLAPRGKATRVTPKLRKQLAEQRKWMEQRRAEMMEKAGEFAAKIEKMTLTFKRKTTAKGKLYAAITEEMVQHEVEKHVKFELEKGSIRISDPIKTVGEHTVTVHLSDTNSAKLNVVVQAEK